MLLPCVLLSHTALVREMGPRVRVDARVAKNAASLTSRVTQAVARAGQSAQTLPFWLNMLAFILHISEDEKMVERYRAAIPWGELSAWLNNLVGDRIKFVSSDLAQDPSDASKTPKVSVEPAQELAETAKEGDKDGGKMDQQHPVDKSTAKKSRDESIQDLDPERQSTGPEADGKSAEPTASSIANVVKPPSSLFLLPQTRPSSRSTKALRSHIQELQGLDWAKPAFILLLDGFGSDIDGRLQDDERLEETKPKPEENKPTSNASDTEPQNSKLERILAKVKEAFQNSSTPPAPGDAHTSDGLDDRRKKGTLTPYDRDNILTYTIVHLAAKIVIRCTTPLRIELDEEREQCCFVTSDVKVPSNGEATKTAPADGTSGNEAKKTAQVGDASGDGKVTIRSDAGLADGETAEETDVCDGDGSTKPSAEPDTAGSRATDNTKTEASAACGEDKNAPNSSAELTKGSESSSREANTVNDLFEESSNSSTGDIPTPEETDDKDTPKEEQEQEPAKNDTGEPGAKRDQSVTGETTESTSPESTSPCDPEAGVDALLSGVAGNQEEDEELSQDLYRDTIFDLDKAWDDFTPENDTTTVPEAAHIDLGEADTVAAGADSNGEKKNTETTIDRPAKDERATSTGLTKSSGSSAREKNKTKEKKKEPENSGGLLIFSFIARPLIKQRDKEAAEPLKPSMGDRVLFQYMGNGNVSIPLPVGGDVGKKTHTKTKQPWEIEKPKWVKKEKTRSVWTPAQIRRKFRLMVPRRARELYQLMTAHWDQFVLFTAILLLLILLGWLLVWLLMPLIVQLTQPPAAAAAPIGARSAAGQPATAGQIAL